MPVWSPNRETLIRTVDLTALAAPYLFNAAQGFAPDIHPRYKFELEAVRPATDGVELWIRTSGNSGATDYHELNQFIRSNDGVIGGSSSAGAAQLGVTPGNVGNVAAAEQGVTGDIWLLHPGSAIQDPTIKWDLSFRDPSTVNFWSIGQGYRRSAAQITSLDLLWSASANFLAGFLHIYGYSRR